MITATIEPNFTSWRQTARGLLLTGADPALVIWNDGSEPMLPIVSNAVLPQSHHSTVTVPEQFISLAKRVSMHRDAARWSLLYRVLYRLTNGQPRLLELLVDDDVHRLREMEKDVHRDLHKMHAFVRFRRLETADREEFVAFHRPDHLIMPAAAPWFARRFAAMRWTILTPDASATWDCQSLRFGPGVAASTVQHDDLEDLWRTYYANIFNPARIKIRAMKKEMPLRHWSTLPETEIIDQLLQQAPTRVEEMMAKTKNAKAVTSAAEFVPKVHKLSVLREASKACKGCDLYCNATQTVFGEGPAKAAIMFVGEQPGDHEDQAGKPFVGPAGQLLDKALEEVGIDRQQFYVTNAVKHFKFGQRGSRRIHSKPSAGEVNACKPWLVAEVEAIKPQLIVALGATAAQAIMGPQFRITQSHGEIFTDTKWAPKFMATIHPSALLRIPDLKLRENAYEQFIDDLKIVVKQIPS
jgi:probable DNA metabolism protein